jgi:hypothetical protein
VGNSPGYSKAPCEYEQILAERMDFAAHKTDYNTNLVYLLNNFVSKKFI